MLEERDHRYQVRLAELQKEVTLGIESSDRGEVYDGEAVVQKLIEQNQKRVVQTVE